MASQPGPNVNIPEQKLLVICLAFVSGGAGAVGALHKAPSAPVRTSTLAHKNATHSTQKIKLGGGCDDDGAVEWGRVAIIERG